jgi:hypothetical protein
MKKIVFFVLIIICRHPGWTQNLVINPGFESWDKITIPSGWTKAESCLKDSINTGSGSYSCLQVCNTTTSKYLGQNIRISPGIQYQLSLYYKTATTTTGNGCRIWCYWKNSEGVSISDPATDNILRPSRYLKSDTWKEFSITAIAPPGASTFYLEVRTYPNSTVYWDDFSFKETILSSKEEFDGEEVTIYPNPVHDVLTINNIHNVKQISIHHSAGIPVCFHVSPGEPMVTIPLNGLAAGLYIIRIRCSDELIVRKFIKE